MPRPRKSRKVCHFPRNLSFSPTEFIGEKEPVFLTVDEYETLRLIDLEGFSQEECGEWMGVARTTGQMIYASARKKLAQMLVEGRQLRIEGGDYRLCDGAKECSQPICFKQYYAKGYAKPADTRRIAVPYETGNICRDFETAQQIRIYDIREKQILVSRLADTGETDARMLPGILTALQTDVLICDQISGGTKLALEAGGIRLVTGISGDADTIVAENLTLL